MTTSPRHRTAPGAGNALNPATAWPELRALVVSNGIREIDRLFPPDARVAYRAAPATADFDPPLDDADLLIVPNGCDHLALARAKPKIRRFLDAGGALFCFDGWFTEWVPGNQWRMDNSKPTREVRYHVGSDRHGLLAGVNLDEFVFNRGISGWWACGYIDAAPGAEILMADTWGRPVVVLDERTTAGTMLLTASGPIPAPGRSDSESGLTRLYHAAIEHIAARRAGERP